MPRRQNSTDDSLVHAMQTQLQHARANPFLFSLLLKQWQRVLKRLAYFYAQLASLPRKKRRVLQRALATSLIGAAMLLALSSAPIVHAGTITVDGDGSSGTCSLADAITTANTGTDTGNCTGGSGGADIIDLQVNVVLGAPLPTVSTTVTLQGNANYISGDGAYRVLEVVTPGNLTIDNTIIKNGSAANAAGIFNNLGTLTVQNQSVITGNQAFGYGGGIGNYHAKTYVMDSTIADNTAYFGGGIANYGGGAYLKVERSTLSGNAAFRGGGVDASLDPFSSPGGYHTTKIYDSTITGSLDGGGVSSIFGDYLGGLVVRNTTISDNYSTDFGAGVNCEYSYVEMTQSSVTGNRAAYDVGGIDLDICYALVFQSTISGNSATLKSANGGIDVDASFLGIVNSTVSGNSSINYYGGIGVYGSSDYTAALYVVNSTVTKNSSQYGYGGGLAVYYGDPSYVRVGIANSIISGNTTRHNGQDVFVPTGFRRAGRPQARRQAEHKRRAAKASGHSWKLKSATQTPHAPVKRKWNPKGKFAAKAREFANAPHAINAVSSEGFNVFGDDLKTTVQSILIPTGMGDITATSNGATPTALASILNPTLGNNSGVQSGDPNTGLSFVQTHALLSSSPAIDKAPNGSCTSFPVSGVDERELARNILITGANGPNNLCDIGAFELQSATAVNVTDVRGGINKNGNAVIKWRTVSESQIAGFHVYRQGKQGEWKQINKTLRQAKHAGAALGDKYRFTDRQTKTAKTYRYKIQVVYLDGHTEWTQVVRVEKP